MHDAFVKLATDLITPNARKFSLFTIKESAVAWDDDTDADYLILVGEILGFQTKLLTSETQDLTTKGTDLKIIVDSQTVINKDMKIRDSKDDRMYGIHHIDEISPANQTIIYKLYLKR